MQSAADRASFAERGQRPARAGAGFALPAALLMILLIAALIAGVFSAITEETRIGVATSDRQHALWSAESAVELTIAAFPDDSMRPGETRSRPVDGLGSASGGLRDTARLRPVTGSSRMPGAHLPIRGSREESESW